MNSVKCNQPVGKQIMVNREIGLTLEQYFYAIDHYLRVEHSARVKRGMRLAKERRAAQAAAEGKPVA